MRLQAEESDEPMTPMITVQSGVRKVSRTLGNFVQVLSRNAKKTQMIAPPCRLLLLNRSEEADDKCALLESNS